MSWTEEKVNKLKELWGKGNTASQIAEIIGGITRNAVIGKAHRLNLSAKIKTRAASSNENFNSSVESRDNKTKRGRKSKFKSLIIEKDFEPENPKQLEELDENSCKWPIGHPDEKSFYFCGRTSLKDFSVGQRVFHEKFGYGSILSLEADKAVVDFEKSDQKNIKTGFLTHEKDV